jgi:hypothetical protein
VAKNKKPKNKKKRNEKLRTPKTTRSTAGSGFDFEDQVAAWLLLKILSGQPLPGVDGSGSRLQMQTESLGWIIDDLLVTCTVAQSNQRHIAVSCKSNVQVTSSGLPNDFVRSAWLQWSKSNAGPMNRDSDCLLLATRGRHPAFQATWSDIKKWSSSSDPALAIARIRAPAKHRKIFDGVKTAAKGAGLSVSDEDALALIRRLDVIPLDFDLSGFEDEKAAIAQSRGLLINSSLGEGRKLWFELIGRTKTARLGNGTIEIAELWRDLRSQFVLKDHPDFAPSLVKLKAITTDYKSIIESALPSGYVLDRKDDAEQLSSKIVAGGVCVLHGESGIGKSALLKSVLDARFPKARQIWFGPDHLNDALSEVERTKLGLIYPLAETLDASSQSENILVIDAAERLSNQCALKAKALIADLLGRKGSDAKAGWRVVIVGQTEAWANGNLQNLAGEALPPYCELKQLSEADVKSALRSADGLQWLATHDDAVSALTNLRTLAWVIEAASRFQGQSSAGLLSLTTIADRLWSYWTDGKTVVQRLLMRLAEREASFEHSFALSELDGPDAEAFDARPNHCPLRVTPQNRIQFQHDLAADWARFQRLKEIAHETERWAVFTANPLWYGALRMLGQFLLRESAGSRSAWDVAFEATEQAKDKMPLAADILLDALYLDPDAETFLNERADMLFENHAARLIRLLKRFEHVASVPGISPEILRGDRHMSLYIESQFRTPIFGRWPAIARFLTRHRERIAVLTSPVVSALCERWLTTTPVTFGRDRPTPFRKEFAELAHDTARDLQLGQAKRIIFLGDFEGPIYSAAFAAAPDLPDEISGWALEMVQRRALRADIAEKILEFRKQQAEEHKKRLETDAEYRDRHARRSEAPTFIGSGTKLPPWPLGPRKRVDYHFRKTVLHSAAPHGLMRVRPAVAAEVLLAAIIEDSPEKPYSRRSLLDQGLGLSYDDQAHPTAYWNSPFFAFLQINPEAALSVLHQLVNFCTDRWEAETRRDGGSPVPKTSVRLADGTVRSFTGDYLVFGWTQANSSHTGQLHCALNALERWLCNLIDGGTDILPYMDNLLRNSNSVAVLGVLINVGKYRVELFKGALRPLLAIHHLYVWDYHRVDNSGGAFFDAFSWVRKGEAVFDRAKDWITAPYRKVKLQQIASDLVSHDKDVAEYILAATGQWEMPAGDKQALEFRILFAELDHRNYKAVHDPTTGKDALGCQYPGDVLRDIQQFNEGHALARQTIHLPYTCERILSSSESLTPAQASALAHALPEIDGDEGRALDENTKHMARVAAAATLLIKAPEWLAQNPAIQDQARAIVNSVMAEIGDAAESLRNHYTARQTGLHFAAHVIAADWIANSFRETDEAVMRLLTSGDERAAQVLIFSAYKSRLLLGPRWWRLLSLALLWAGLIILAPGYDDDDSVKPRWQRWLRWLRARSLSGEQSTADSVNPLAIAKRVETFERRRWQQRYARQGRPFEVEPGRRHSGGLETHFLQHIFSWLFGEAAQPPANSTEAEEMKKIVSRFWAYEAWCRSGSADEDDRDYQPLSQMGYAVVSTLARIILEASPNSSAELWPPIFQLGPKGHYSIGTFLTSWFSQITETTDAASFVQRWRPMIEYIRGATDWDSGHQWFYGQQLERQVLGFGAETYIKRVTDLPSLIRGMQDLYKAWADKRLRGDEGNIAGFCEFLSTDAGRPLRMVGLQWIATAIEGESGAGRWHRDSAASGFMAFLNVMISEHGEEITTDANARQALLNLVANAVSRQIPAALALQERVRKML